MSKLSIPLVCGVFLGIGWIGGQPGRAASAPEVSANRVIELVPINSGEKTPVVSSVALDPAGKLLAAVGDDHLVRIFDIQSGDVVHRWRSHTDWVRASAFRPDGQVLATSGADRQIRLWDVSGRSRPRDLAEQLPVIYSLAYSPDGRMLAVAGFADKVWIIDADQGSLLRELVGPGHDIRALSFSPDGTRLAAAGRAGLVRIWEAPSGKPLANVQVSTRRIWALAYSPDGKYLAAAGQQRVVRLLDAAAGQPAVDLPERPGEVLSLVFCGPDTLASAGSSNVIHLWDLAARQERRRLVGHTGSVTTLALTPADLLSMPDGERVQYELSDGELITMGNAGMWHELIKSGILVGLIAYQLQHPEVGRVFAESLFQLNPTTARQPDVAFVGAAKVALLSHANTVIPVAPDLAIEVISETETAAAAETKVQEYLAAGVREVWQFYPWQSKVRVRTSDRIYDLTGDQLLETPVLPGFSVRVSSFFD